MRTSLENTVSTVSSVRESGPESGSEQQPWDPASHENGRFSSRPTLRVPSTAADDADGADAKATSPFGQLG
jgi:hypothetical protein